MWPIKNIRLISVVLFMAGPGWCAVQPNDPDFFNQTALSFMKAPDAWSTSTGNSNITIAYIDNGLFATHPDLTPNLVTGWNFVDNNNVTNAANSRGTYTAGASAAATNNGLNGSAVCWNCKIMPLKVSVSQTSAPDQAVATALNYAKDRGVKIAVVAYGMTGSPLTAAAAQQFVASGGLVVAAAGNDGAVLTIPNDPNILTVNAIHSLNELYSWSNSGPVVDMAAPGWAYTTAPSGGMATWWDSSVSAAYVAAVAALVKAANPVCTGTQLANILKQSADDIGVAGPDTTFGNGRLNALRAVGMAGTCSASSVSPCDVNGDGSTNVLDVQQEVNQALGAVSCTNDLNNDGVCNVLDIQCVTNAALGGPCVSS